MNEYHITWDKILGYLKTKKNPSMSRSILIKKSSRVFVEWIRFELTVINLKCFCRCTSKFFAWIIFVAMKSPYSVTRPKANKDERNIMFSNAKLSVNYTLFSSS